MDKNTPELWDNFWEKNELRQDDLDAVKYELLTIRWQRIENITIDHFGQLSSPRTPQ